MIDLNEAAERIIQNRRRRGFQSETDLSKTTLGLVEEVGEFEKARKEDSEAKMINALVDTMVFCLGGLGILGTDPESYLAHVLEENETRDHKGQH